jgi:hypothetical protein
LISNIDNAGRADVRDRVNTDEWKNADVNASNPRNNTAVSIPPSFFVSCRE